VRSLQSLPGERAQFRRGGACKKVATNVETSIRNRKVKEEGCECHLKKEGSLNHGRFKDRVEENTNKRGSGDQTQG